jgi:hypothetical protein
MVCENGQYDYKAEEKEDGKWSISALIINPYNAFFKIVLNWYLFYFKRYL